MNGPTRDLKAKVWERAELAAREEWRSIPSFPGYFASSLGRVRGKRGWVMTPFIPKDGYPQITFHRGGVQHVRDLHVLVCEAFNGPRPSERHEVAHNDGVRRNCAPANLRWATRAENRDDMKRHGSWPSHEKHPRATITFAAATEIRLRHSRETKTPSGRVPRGWRQRTALEFGITVSALKDILIGRAWT